MNIKLRSYNKSLVFEASNDTGYSLLVGQANKKALATVRPMELILTGLASCSSVDIVKILNKQKIVDFDYDVLINGERYKAEIPSTFKEITLIYSFEGKLPEHKVKRAVELSLNKYCSVSKMLEPTVSINHKIIINGKEL